jgi:hypothetical protein
LAEALSAGMVAAIFIAAILIATILIATALGAAVFQGNLMVIAGAVVAGGGAVAGKVVAGKVVARKSVAGKLGRGDRGDFKRGSRDSGVLELALAQGCEIVRYGFVFVKADLAGVGADETFIEDAAGELVEVFVFEGAQHAGADFRGGGDGLEFDAAQLALLAKFFSKGAHAWLRLRFCPHSI